MCAVLVAAGRVDLPGQAEQQGEGMVADRVGIDAGGIAQPDTAIGDGRLGLGQSIEHGKGAARLAAPAQLGV